MVEIMSMFQTMKIRLLFKIKKLTWHHVKINLDDNIEYINGEKRLIPDDEVAFYLDNYQAFHSEYEDYHGINYETSVYAIFNQKRDSGIRVFYNKQRLCTIGGTGAGPYFGLNFNGSNKVFRAYLDKCSLSSDPEVLSSIVLVKSGWFKDLA